MRNHGLKMKNYIFLIVFFLFSCHQTELINTNQSDQVDPRQERIIIMYTNDEHGWMEGTDDHGGAATLLNTWIENENCEPEAPCLILSGGDMWTGPAISTLTNGESMVHVMNAMGYDAAALGNHEFDFGVENLKKRISDMDFPILAANLHYKDSGKRPDFVKPYLITEVGNVKVGIIGLALIQTPMMTKLENVDSYVFTDYAAALEESVPLARSEGAEMLIVVGHICHQEMVNLAALASTLGISLIGGGHCHELYEDRVSGVTLVQSGSNLRNYVKIDILFDIDADTLVSIAAGLHANQEKSEDITISEIISTWRSELDHTLLQVVGYTHHEIIEESAEMANMITDSWLYTYPRAQIALTNTGGIRQPIPGGNITIEMIYGVLPFSNNILELSLSGEEILESLSPSIVMSGLTSVDGYRLRDGEILHPDSLYTVLINDFMYTHPGSDFNLYDQNPYDTGINYRQPLIDWIRSLNTSPENPLDKYLDYTRR